MSNLPKTRDYGLVFVYPWNYPWHWSFPVVVRTSKHEDGKQIYSNKPVALSFGRAAIVFDIAWWRGWIK
jgi:hypothetical protein